LRTWNQPIWAVSMLSGSFIVSGEKLDSIPFGDCASAAVSGLFQVHLR
jgi:hypothetical protein